MIARRLLPLLFVFTTLSAAGKPPAKNVVLFIGDAGGLATLHAASVYKYNDSQRLFIQRMPHIGLSDTSTAAEWVSDSAAGMTAIVTGQRTLNGVLSQGPDAVRGQRDGTTLKTILEEAEERGLSTGIVTNMAITDATPAACYAHVSARANTRDIVAQLLAPKYGDGPDVVIGAPPPAPKDDVDGALQKELAAGLAKLGYAFSDTIPAVAEKAPRRVAAIVPAGDFQLQQAIDVAMSVLRRNPKGYFLMVEWDMHTSRLKRGLDRVVEMDAAVEKLANTAGRDTLVVFTADHSYDLRMRGGKKGEAVLPEEAPTTAVAPAANGQATAPKVGAIRVEDGHTGEQVLVAAQGPGAEAVRGFLQNTDLYRIMRNAYGWKTPASAPAAKNTK